jgi:hypothetical protein
MARPYAPHAVRDGGWAQPLAHQVACHAAAALVTTDVDLLELLVVHHDEAGHLVGDDRHARLWEPADGPLAEGGAYGGQLGGDVPVVAVVPAPLPDLGAPDR